MNTISINPTLYNRAEMYANIHHISLNELAEKALLMLVGHKKQTVKKQMLSDFYGVLSETSFPSIEEIKDVMKDEDKDINQFCL